MNGAHLASPIRGELGYAHWPQLGSQIYCIIENQIWGPIGKQDLCPNFALTAAKFVFSNSGNFRAKVNPPKPRSCPKRPFGQLVEQNSGADWVIIIILRVGRDGALVESITINRRIVGSTPALTVT